MANNYINGLVQIRPVYSGVDTADTPENVTWWKGTFTTGLTAAQASAIQTIFDADWGNVWKIAGASDATFLGSVLTDWSSNTGISHTTVGSDTPLAGLATGFLANNSAALVSLVTAMRFRGGHGRIYLPCIGTSVTADPSHLASGTVSTMNTNYASLTTAMAAIAGSNGGGFVQQLFRYRNSPGSVAHPITHPASLVAVTGTTVQAELASQRRRLRKAAHR